MQPIFYVLLIMGLFLAYSLRIAYYRLRTRLILEDIRLNFFWYFDQKKLRFSDLLKSSLPPKMVTFTTPYGRGQGYIYEDFFKDMTDHYDVKPFVPVNMSEGHALTFEDLRKQRAKLDTMLRSWQAEHDWNSNLARGLHDPEAMESSKPDYYTQLLKSLAPKPPFNRSWDRVVRTPGEIARVSLIKALHDPDFKDTKFPSRGLRFERPELKRDDFFDGEWPDTV